MLSALYQRGGFTGAAVDPLTMSAITDAQSSSSSAEAVVGTKRRSHRGLRSDSATSMSSSSMSNHAVTDNDDNNRRRERTPSEPPRRSIHERLRVLTGEMLTEEALQAKFTFGRLLGSGATSKVYAALDNASGREVAIKVFDKAAMIEVRRSMVANGEYVQEKAVHRVRRRLLKIISELEISRRLHHPNIIEFLGAYETSHRLCIVHELVDGCDLLEHLLTHGRMSESLAASVFRQLLLALQYCHAQNVYHRDLKLENVLLTKDLQVKLIDFGLSEIVPPGETLRTICGTPLYCSPEVLFLHSSRRDVGFAGGPADIWSIGVLIFALLTGCAPFDDSNFHKLRLDVQRNRIAYPSYLSHHVRGLLKLVLIFDPHLRPTVEDLLEDAWIRSGAASATATTAQAAAATTSQADVATSATSGEAARSSGAEITVSHTAKAAPGRPRSLSGLSDNGTDTTASTSGSFDADGAAELRKITEEPHEPEISLPTHLSCLERELEQLLTTTTKL